MAGNEPISERIVIKKVYTFNEAIEYEKRLDKEPTNYKTRPNWVCVKTGKEVIIGYNNLN